MPGVRSRLGCDECRGRRRKCDEQKPICGQCAANTRTCNYTLKVVWDAGRKAKPRKPPLPGHQTLQFAADQDETAQQRQPDLLSRSSEPALEQAMIKLPEPERTENSRIGGISDDALTKLSFRLPRSLPNGVPLSPRYHRLLNYFTHDVLASLSCHPSVHEDLCRGLIPATFHSPQLLSACLALSAAGLLSRGLFDVDGVGVSRILEHLQSSGLSLLRSSLEAGQMDETLLATCLIWCLADVFTHRQGSSSWRIHLQGIKAILDGSQAHHYFATESNSKAAQLAMRHLYLLYLSLQTLPHTPSLPDFELLENSTTTNTMRKFPERITEDQHVLGSNIDGFLGYSEELLHVLQEVNRMSQSEDSMAESSLAEADVLLGKVNAMISRDTQAPPDVSIVSSLSPEYNREFALCHMTFQQATLIHIYRRLYRLPSNSDPIQAAVERISEMVCNMTQGQPCHTWVAMAMPLFTMGCEAFTEQQQAFALDKVHKLEICLGSFHVRTIRQALEDIWRIRRDAGDVEGNMCATNLLGK